MPLTAHAKGLFEVRDVIVDARERTVNEARATALAQGQRDAFALLLRRITRAQDWAVLPNTNDMNAQDFVLNFSVQDEKNSQRRYLATMSVQFDIERVLTLLQGLNIPYVETQAKPALLIPLLEDDTGYHLWDDNWWRQSWAELDLANVPAPIVVAVGDGADATTLSVEDVLLGDTKSMSQLAARYNANTVIVAHASAPLKEEKSKTRARARERARERERAKTKTKTKSARDENRLDVTVYQYSALGSRLFVRNFKTRKDLNDLGAQAATAILDELSAEWKDQAVVRLDQQATFTVAADYDRMSEWLTMLERLKAARFIKNLDIHVLAARGSVISLSYTGSVGQLMSNLAQNDLILTENENGWRLKLSR